MKFVRRVEICGQAAAGIPDDGLVGGGGVSLRDA